MAGPQPGWERRRVKVMVLEKCWVEWIVMFCVGESKWALLRVHVSTERVLVLGTACRWQSMWVNNQPYARPSRMYINAGRCVGACFTAETLGYNWCISLLSAWFDGIFDDTLYPFIFYFLFFFIFYFYDTNTRNLTVRLSYNALKGNNLLTLKLAWRTLIYL